MSEEFWDAAAPLLAEGTLEEGTIMGGPCVRAGGEFVGMPHQKGPGIVVKLPRDRVDELIEAGDVDAHDENRWVDLLHESIRFVNP